MPVRSCALAAVVAASLALVPAASAHNLSRSPASGDVNTLFQFKGTRWQPNRNVTWRYFRTPSSGLVRQTGTVRANSSGAFTFNWRDSLIGVDFGVTHMMCFRQFDTRLAFRRTFERCANFYVAPPYAQFMPNEVNSTDTFVLFVAGFFPGRVLDVSLRLNTGFPYRSIPITTASTGSFRTVNTTYAGGPTTIYVPRGGALLVGQLSSGNPGIHIARVLDSSTGMRAYAAFQQ